MHTYDRKSLPDHPIRITPAGLAGPGDAQFAIRVLQVAGWKVTTDEYDNTYAWSPDRLHYVGYEPEGWANSMPVPQDTLWVVVCYLEIGKRAWTADFDTHTPAELVAGFLQTLVDSAGLVRDPRDPLEMLPPPRTWATYTDAPQATKGPTLRQMTYQALSKAAERVGAYQYAILARSSPRYQPTAGHKELIKAMADLAGDRISIEEAIACLHDGQSGAELQQAREAGF